MLCEEKIMTYILNGSADYHKGKESMKFTKILLKILNMV